MKRSSESALIIVLLLATLNGTLTKYSFVYWLGTVAFAGWIVVWALRLYLERRKP